MAFFNKRLPVFRPKRSTFNLSHSNLLTLKMGKLVPIQCIEVAPGDKFRLGVSVLGRLQPLNTPAMVNMDVRFYHFYSPYRLLWTHADDFFTGGANGKAVERPLWPKFNPNLISIPDEVTNWNTSLFGYLSYAYRNKPATDMPIRMYSSIWNEYFRNENIQDEIDYDKDYSGNDSNTWVEIHRKTGDGDILLHRNWDKDYFTAAQPWTQKGNEVFIPLDVTAEQFALVASPYTLDPSRPNNPLVVKSGVGTVHEVTTMTANDTTVYSPSTPTVATKFSIVDPSTGQPYEFASGLSVNVLRESLALQKMLERKLRYGSRLVEYLLGVHGVKLSDKTAQRVRFIGGNTVSMQIGELLQTSATQDGQPLGQMSGTGYMRGTGNGGSYYCEEYGMIMTLAVVIPKVGYTNVVPKWMYKDDPYDFLLPQFAHLGDQEIYNYEINANHVEFDGVFGYIGRYDEYRTMVDEVHGDFKGNLNDWHMYRELPNNVALNTDFITANPTTRIFNVQTTNASDVLMQTYLHTYVQRNLPKYAIPR